MKDPRDMVGDNPTGRPTRSGARRRRREARRALGLLPQQARKENSEDRT